MCRKGWAWLRHPNLPGTATPTSPGLGPSFPRGARARSSRAGALPAGTARAPAARGSSSLKAEKRKLLPEPGRGFSVLRKLLISRLSEGPRLPIHTPGAPKPHISFIPPGIQRGQRGDSYSRCQLQPPKRCQTLPGNPWGTPGSSGGAPKQMALLLRARLRLPKAVEATGFLKPDSQR